MTFTGLMRRFVKSLEIKSSFYLMKKMSQRNLF